jgi:hypothetical protein
MKKLNIRYNLNQLKEAVHALENLLANEEELEEKKDIQPFFKSNPVLIIAISELVGMSSMNIDELEFEFQLWHDFICDVGFGSSKTNTYCLIELEDAKKNSIFKRSPKNHPKFSERFENGFSQIIDWFWKIDGLKNASTEMEHLVNTHNPTIKSILIIGRSNFLKSSSELARLKWRVEKTVVDSKRINCYTYDELLNYFKFLVEKKEEEKLLDME